MRELWVAVVQLCGERCVGKLCVGNCVGAVRGELCGGGDMHVLGLWGELCVGNVREELCGGCGPALWGMCGEVWGSCVGGLWWGAV